MGLALKEAQKAYEKEEVPIGAVVARNGEVISRAHNKKENLNDATAHAEILAIKKAGARMKSWRLVDCDLYVTVEPCPMCAGAIVQARVERVIFGALDKKAWGNLRSEYILENSALNHQVKVVAGVMEANCEEIIKKFFKGLRNDRTSSFWEM